MLPFPTSSISRGEDNSFLICLTACIENGAKMGRIFNARSKIPFSQTLFFGGNGAPPPSFPPKSVLGNYATTSLGVCNLDKASLNNLLNKPPPLLEEGG